MPFLSLPTLSWVSVGHVSDAHGLKGEVYVRLATPAAEWLSAVDTLQLGEGGATYQVERAKRHRHGAIFRLVGVADRTAAEALKGLSVQIASSLLVAAPGEAPYLNEVLGFIVEIVGRGDVGRVVGFRFNGVQDLVVVAAADGREEREIPLIEPFLQEMKLEEQRLVMQLPPGFWEICQ